MDVVVFELGGRRCGVDLRLVQAVIPLGPVTPVPMAPPAIAGAVNVRGEVAAVIDLALLLGSAPATPRQGGLALLVEAEGCRAVVCADRVEEVSEVPVDAASLNPEGQSFGGPPGPLLLVDLAALLRRLIGEVAAAARSAPLLSEDEKR